jgi:hypothetical protein
MTNKYGIIKQYTGIQAITIFTVKLCGSYIY